MDANSWEFVEIGCLRERLQKALADNERQSVRLVKLQEEIGRLRDQVIVLEGQAEVERGASEKTA